MNKINKKCENRNEKFSAGVLILVISNMWGQEM